jgi:hypothetical protein
MKIILDTDTGTDNITSVTANSEDAEFVDDNLLNNWTTDCWKAASGTSAILTFEVSKGSAILIFNTNATSAVVWAGSGESFEWEADWAWETDWSWSNDEVATAVTYDLPGVRGRLWAEYPEFAGAHVVKVTLTAAAIPYAGIARAGVVQSFADPKYGMSEESKDFSIEKELNNGATYFRKRGVVRSYPKLELLDTRAKCFTLKHDIFDAVGPEPLAIKLISETANITDDEFILFAKRIDSPEISHTTLTHSKVELSLTEVI